MEVWNSNLKKREVGPSMTQKLKYLCQKGESQQWSLDVLNCGLIAVKNSKLIANRYCEKMAKFISRMCFKRKSSGSKALVQNFYFFNLLPECRAQSMQWSTNFREWADAKSVPRPYFVPPFRERVSVPERQV